MSNYYLDINHFLENLSCQYFNQYLHQFNTIRNNLHHHDIDLLITRLSDHRAFTIDVQYSMNFARYGDVRIDLMSAGQLNADVQHCTAHQLNQILSQSTTPLSTFKQMFTIQKYGKYFAQHQKPMLGIFYYFYNHQFDKTLSNFQQHTAHYYFFLPRSVVLQEIQAPRPMIKINDKISHHLPDKHHSAFICLNVAKLVKQYRLPLFTDIQQLSQLQPLIVQEFDHYG